MSLIIRPMLEADFAAASEVFRDSFRSYLKLTDNMVPDSDFIRTRALNFPQYATVATYQGEIIGSNLGTDWGSIALCGPTTVRPRGWTGTAGRDLLQQLDRDLQPRGNILRVGYTFADSAKHINFFRGAGLRPRYLIGNLTKYVRRSPTTPAFDVQWLSKLDPSELPTALSDFREITESVYPGFDLQHEIKGTVRFGFGDAILIREGSRTVGAALVHVGAGTDAGSNTCHLKFGAALPTERVEQSFLGMLQACECYAAARGVQRMTSGVNLGREQALNALLNFGFMCTYQGVALSDKDDSAYNHPKTWVADDWR